MKILKTSFNDSVLLTAENIEIILATKYPANNKIVKLTGSLIVFEKNRNPKRQIVRIDNPKNCIGITGSIKLDK